MKTINLKYISRHKLILDSILSTLVKDYWQGSSWELSLAYLSHEYDARSFGELDICILRHVKYYETGSQ